MGRRKRHWYRGHHRILPYQARTTCGPKPRTVDGDLARQSSTTLLKLERGTHYLGVPATGGPGCSSATPRSRSYHFQTFTPTSSLNTNGFAGVSECAPPTQRPIPVTVFLPVPGFPLYAVRPRGDSYYLPLQPPFFRASSPSTIQLYQSK